MTTMFSFTKCDCFTVAQNRGALLWTMEENDESKQEDELRKLSGHSKLSKDTNSSVSRPICLDVVADNRHRSLAKLQCGHQFNLEQSMKDHHLGKQILLQLWLIYQHQRQLRCMNSPQNF
ncbi:unnamed protein product [Lupinus luteus]|uniref:Uncharacterized protein n=1 Tax=Lupinus luteus TaxID=3873 RepID=A0AAV1WBK6_LUPLU